MSLNEPQRVILARRYLPRNGICIYGSLESLRGPLAATNLNQTAGSTTSPVIARLPGRIRASHHLPHGIVQIG